MKTNLPFKKLLAPAAGALAAIALMTGAASAATAYSSTTLNVRSGPGTGYRAVDVLHTGERVDVQTCRGGWCFISHRGADGWVSASYLDGGNYAPAPRHPEYYAPAPRRYYTPRWDHHYDRHYGYDRHHYAPRYRSGNSITFGFSFGN